MSFEPVDVYVLDTSPQQNPVEGVTVKVLSADGVFTYTQAATDENGHVGFLLPSDLPYQMRMYKFAVGFTNPQLFTVLEAPVVNSFNVAATLLTPPVSPDPRLCVAFGYFRDLTGAPQAFVDVNFIAKFDPVWLDGAAVMAERTRLRTDRKGYMEVNLIRNAHYDCTVQGEEDVVRRIKVPDAANVNLADLLFPIVSSVVLTPPGPYALTVGQELLVGYSVFASDGEDLKQGYADVKLFIGNHDVVGYSRSPAGLTLIGIGPGTTTICFERTNTSIVHIPCTPILNGVLTVTVTS